MKRFVLLFILQLFIAGCSTVPFQETRLVLLGSEDPRNRVERFQKGIPESFQLLNERCF